MKIAVVLPAYNEAARIGAVLEALPAEVSGNELIAVVVDDGSRDETSRIAKKFSRVKVIRHRTNLGKGAAAKTGCDAACKLGADIIVLMDSDGQHKSVDIARMVEPLLTDRLDQMVIGAREIGGSMPFMMRLGNKALNAVTKFLFGVDCNDSQSGFRAFSRQVYPSIRWASSSYAMETEMLILAAHSGVTLAEVPIETIYLDNYKGTTALDGLRIAKTLFKWRLLWFREYNSLESFSV
jgi:glycosyltransferase involved in cell wall biosynthesis